MSSFSKKYIRIKEENDLEVYNIQPGSRLQVDRGVYSHWAIYIGNGEVCHLTENNADTGGATSSSASFLASVDNLEAIVLIESFTDMLNGEKPAVYVNNSADSKWKPLPRAEIVKRAKGRVGVTKFNLTANNCEHFANWCRYGQNKSDQVKDAEFGLRLGSVIAAVGAVALAGIFVLAKQH